MVRRQPVGDGRCEKRVGRAAAQDYFEFVVGSEAPSNSPEVRRVEGRLDMPYTPQSVLALKHAAVRWWCVSYAGD